MNKSKLNAIVDVLIAVFFVFSAFSGWVLDKKILGGGLGRGRNLLGTVEFLSLDRHGWASLHGLASWLLVAFVFVHLVLHFNWIKNLPGLLKK
ncbi:hypothetical protein COT64_03665 [Candidatus Shapirobacteria bacterium CG09_land_8_20_14_0_10_39_12]|uniref:Flavinylation-associated cytochrome domain-containing protein n=1 Tax=Candidatus Shapirobacteria bacterium CG09_land_8_20_14_0_10_39_12 TaxID=1974885 RepID=A0A2H0WNP2_9BACT|nr:MAG: hypothetical protein COT64_03665 [Candidatus Shapirobacteria bacterium CG09_land_8_20_14_0_10_39_12]